jgi:type I restriction enzyme S subunit
MRIEVPDEWKVRTLRSLAIGNGEYGANISKSPFNPEWPRYIRITDIGDQGLFNNDAASISEENAAPYLLEDGDILLARSGATVGKSLLYQSSFGTAAHAGYLVRFRLRNDEALPAYVIQYLRSEMYWRWVRIMARAGAQPNINSKEYGRLSIPLPPLPEQKKIAAILSSVDEAIQATQAVIEQTRRVKEGLLQELLTRGIGHTRFKQTAIGEIPEEWDTVRLSQIVVNDNGLQTGPFGSQLHACDYTDAGVPVVMPKDIIGGGITDSTVARIPEELANSSSLRKHRLRIGDIVFSRRGDIGRCGLVETTHQGWLCGTGCLRVRPCELVEPAFLNHRIRYHETLAWLNDNAVGQTMLNLNTAILGSVPLSLPPLHEQKKIAEILSQLDNAADAGGFEVFQLQSMKAGLLQDLLTGKVRVSV